MKKDSSFKVIAAIGIASVVIIGATVAISLMGNKDKGKNDPVLTTTPTPVPTTAVSDGSTKLDLKNANEKITDAKKNADGTYTLTITEQGYIGPVTLEVNYTASAEQVINYKVISHTETEGLGSLVTEDEYRNQLAGSVLPIYTADMDLSEILTDNANNSEEDSSEENKNETEAEFVYTDGVYEAVGEPASNGYIAHVTVTIDNGAITAVNWDEEKEGEWKKQLSEDGKYVMVEGNPIWKEQSETMALYVLEMQSTDGLNLNESGKTDAVSGVSISVDNFAKLVNQALDMAAGKSETTQDGIVLDATLVEAVSGATYSSKAVIRAINEGYVFLRDHIINE